MYSKASRYTASRCMDLDNVRFWIGSKQIWDARIYVVKAARFFDALAFALKVTQVALILRYKSFSIPQKTCIKALLFLSWFITIICKKKDTRINLALRSRWYILLKVKFLITGILSTEILKKHSFCQQISPFFSFQYALLSRYRKY